MKPKRFNSITLNASLFTSKVVTKNKIYINFLFSEQLRMDNTVVLYVAYLH